MILLFLVGPVDLRSSEMARKTSLGAFYLFKMKLLNGENTVWKSFLPQIDFRALFRFSKKSRIKFFEFSQGTRSFLIFHIFFHKNGFLSQFHAFCNFNRDSVENRWMVPRWDLEVGSKETESYRIKQHCINAPESFNLSDDTNNYTSITILLFSISLVNWWIASSHHRSAWLYRIVSQTCIY